MSCSFCRKHQREVDALVVAPSPEGPFICDECIALCNDILADRAARRPEDGARDDRRRDWMVTASGRRMWLLDPVPDEIDIRDIAHALARIGRFTGHARRFYSVAQHAVHVSHLVPPVHALAGLLHDATEAYLGDVSRPLKLLLPFYRELERRWETAIALRFPIPLNMPLAIKEADLVALATERRDLMTVDPSWGGDWFRAAAPGRIEPLAPEAAEALFLARFRELTETPS